MQRLPLISATELRAKIPNLVRVAQDLYGIVFTGSIARCPFPENHSHGDRTPSLRYDKKKDRIFCASQQCFGEKGVDAISLVQKMDQCSFSQAVRRLSDFYGIAQPTVQTAGPLRTDRNQRHHDSSGDVAPILAEYVRATLAPKGFSPTAEFPYGPSLRTVRFEHESRIQSDKPRAEKEFRWEHLVDGVWYSGDGGIPKPLYVNKVFRERDQVGLVLGFEGEAKADLAGDLGFAAFSFKNITREQAATLADCDVILWPDNDASGRNQAASAADVVNVVNVVDQQSHVRTVRLLIPHPDFGSGGDIIDAVKERKWDITRIREYLDTATPFAGLHASNSEPSRATAPASGASRDSAQHVMRCSAGWPVPLRDEAYYGLAGQLVRLIEPHSESDPAALLVQFLVCFGSLIGRKAHFRVESDFHYTNLFAVMVGQTSKGRKGTALGHVLRVLGAVDPEWLASRQTSGLASGEGLIWAVRDPIHANTPIREKGRVSGYENIVIDSGQSDKRLLVVEPEFARVLRVCERESNTLSAVLRQAWDNGDLHVLTKNQASQTTGAHISVIGHITKDELCRQLSSTAAGNGFANRFLWICTKRSKQLPEGGSLGVEELAGLVKEVAQAVEFAVHAELICRDEGARCKWYEVYSTLSAGRPGLLGAITSRAEAQVLRLALLYALLDCSSAIRLEHLNAGLAVWQYSMESAEFVFGGALGDRVADAIHAELRERPEGMSRTDIRDFLGRNRRADEIQRALLLLQESGLANMERGSEQGEIRPTERWFAQ